MTGFRLHKCALWLGAASLAIPIPAQAQFGGLFSRNKASAAEKTSDGCPEGKSRSTGSSILGGVLGSVAGGAASRLGVTRWVPVSAFTSELTQAIACRLDPEEQKQAAEATLAATRGGEDGEVEVGSSASWTSGTREEVAGTSTVVARNDGEGGLQCITVTDVIIVKGEETTANKRMCRPPGQRRYSLVA